MLSKGEISIFEPGLSDLVKRNIYYKRLEFTTSIQKATEESEVIFIAVGPPLKDDGNADLINVKDISENMAYYYMNNIKLLLTNLL